ncbi:glycosyltransferase [Ulvibacter sp. MAR_2010_11]|uniref:glycosyltransferase n=1 Tax=Ulvibacter sp. MAR_2010_11 TaxID=1250229 RepID=UPI001E2E3B48|nr:glycosyltransferase [Ulvibacter sp. MAR_2010_11]
MHIYGAGPEAEAIGKLKNPEIVFHGEIDRAKLHQEITKYDIGFIPLVNRIYGSVPSKIFEYTKLGLPILYYAGGEGEGLVTDYKLGWSIPVNNINFLQQFIDELSKEKLNEFPKDMVKKKADLLFDFHKQFKMFNTKIESL